MRIVDVVPPSKSNEEFRVVMVISAVILCALSWIVATRPAAGIASDVLPFQTSFQDLPAAEQRKLRELLEGLDEAKRRRATAGAWPLVERLAQDQIPPFAPDPLDPLAYRWSLRSEGLVSNYLGMGDPDLLLLIQEPDPAGGEVAQGAVVDEEHQLLPDGKLLHVTYWRRAHAAPPSGLIARPEVEGWTQIRLQAR